MPIFGSIGFVYIATLIFQVGQQWEVKAALSFHGLLLLHAMNYLFRRRIYGEHRLLYFMSQGFIIFILSATVQPNYLLIYLGLLPIGISQAIHICKDRYQTLLVIFGYYSLFIGTSWINSGLSELPSAIALLMLISASIISYSRMYLKQMEAKEQSQLLWIQLDHAYQRLEHSVQEKEREKLARDLHDTLSQSVVGIIMKLEAMDTFMEAEEYEKCSTILKKSIIQGKASLKETRQLIGNLRSAQQEECRLEQILKEEVYAVFDEKYAIILDVPEDQSIYVSVYEAYHIRLIIRELCMNIYRHAEADQVIVRAVFDSQSIMLQIQDNGIGVDSKKDLHRTGNYGIKGIYERCRCIEAQLLIDSQQREILGRKNHRGTIVTLWLEHRGNNNEESFTH